MDYLFRNISAFYILLNAYLGEVIVYGYIYGCQVVMRDRSHRGLSFTLVVAFASSGVVSIHIAGWPVLPTQSGRELSCCLRTNVGACQKGRAKYSEKRSVCVSISRFRYTLCDNC